MLELNRNKRFSEVYIREKGLTSQLIEDIKDCTKVFFSSVKSNKFRPALSVNVRLLFFGSSFLLSKC